MLKNEYPEHDINQVFDYMEKIIDEGGVHDDTREEFLLINKLFASLPPEAVEYGMRFLHGQKDLPKATEELMPLYIRFVNLLEYLEKIDQLRQIPQSMSTEEIMARSDMTSSLDEHEKPFGKPLLGYKFNMADDTPVQTETDDADGESTQEPIHLMNLLAPVISCKDMLATSLFYENNLGFKAAHLDDETMPHIRLTRDNAVIILAEDPIYDFYIYASEPMLLYCELQDKVKIIKPLEEAGAKSGVNREFVFEDKEGRRYCVSQNMEF